MFMKTTTKKTDLSIQPNDSLPLTFNNIRTTPSIVPIKNYISKSKEHQSSKYETYLFHKTLICY